MLHLSSHQTMILQGLIQTWQKRARRTLDAAAAEPLMRGRRLIEHGALCTLRCAEELETLIMANGEEHPKEGEDEQPQPAPVPPAEPEPEENGEGEDGGQEPEA